MRHAHPKARLESEISAIVRRLATSWGVPPAEDVHAPLVRPKGGHADLCTPIAMPLSRLVKQSPDALASSIAGAVNEATQRQEVPYVERADSIRGFVNLTLSPLYAADVLQHVRVEGESFGGGDDLARERWAVEAVSANPTGHVSVVNGRAAVFGDVLQRLMRFLGAEVATHYYVNDSPRSGQMLRFAASVLAQHESLETGEPPALPEDGYQGAYVRDLADSMGEELRRWRDVQGPAFGPETILPLVAQRMAAGHRVDLEALGVAFDAWTSEASTARGEDAIEMLAEAGAVYVEVDGEPVFLETMHAARPEEGPLWFATHFFDGGVEPADGDARRRRDSVLRRADGSCTYFANDVDYHLDTKSERGAWRLFDVFGADHQGHETRLRAALKALGRAGLLEVETVQLVSLTRDGVMSIGSKRLGNVAPLSGFVAAVGRDAARWVFLADAPESHSTIDVLAAAAFGLDNPVYYVQYAHARLAGVLRKAAEAGYDVAAPRWADLSLLVHPTERALALRISEFPDVVRSAVERRRPHLVREYAYGLAQDANSFYASCRALPLAEVGHGLGVARLRLVEAARRTIGNALWALGVDAPDQMTERGD